MKKLTILAMIFVLAALSFAEMNVTITSPAEGSKFEACSDIMLTADVEVISGEFKEVRFYANAKHIKRDTKAPFEGEWKGAQPGFWEITAQAKDQDGNVFISEPVNVVVGNVAKYNVLQNGGFDCSITPWVKQLHEGGEFNAELMTDGWFDDDTYLAVTIVNKGAQDWSCQLGQDCRVDSGHTYEFSFLADTDSEKDITLLLQGTTEPYAEHFKQEIMVSEFGAFGPYTWECMETVEHIRFKFILSKDESPIFLDDVRMIDLTAQTTIVEERFETPTNLNLIQNYPNPFNPNTTIEYHLDKTGYVELAIYNLNGELVKMLTSGLQNAGQHHVVWNATNESGNSVPSGVYFYRLMTSGKSLSKIKTGKMTLLK